MKPKFDVRSDPLLAAEFPEAFEGKLLTPHDLAGAWMCVFVRAFGRLCEGRYDPVITHQYAELAYQLEAVAALNPAFAAAQMFDRTEPWTIAVDRTELARWKKDNRDGPPIKVIESFSMPTVH